MNRIPDDQPNGFDSQDLNAVIRRLGKAGWLEGENYVNTKELVVRYSETGYAKMREFHNFIKSLPGSFFRSSSKPGDQPDATLMFAGIVKYAPEMLDPLLSGREFQAFFELAFAFKDDQSGPNDGRNIKPPPGGAPPAA